MNKNLNLFAADHLPLNNRKVGTTAKRRGDPPTTQAGGAIVRSPKLQAELRGSRAAKIR